MKELIEWQELTNKDKDKDREIVRKTAYENLKGSNIYVNEQFPREIELKRKLLYPVKREAGRAGDRVVLLWTDFI